MLKTLLLGCGQRRQRLFAPSGGLLNFDDLTTVDINPVHKPDLLWDLSSPEPLPFPDNSFDEICAYELLEHIADQGDYVAFFRQFADYWRLLKPDGLFTASVPLWNGIWAYGDPSHRRVINAGTLVFLDQQHYIDHVGQSPMSDFRDIWRGDFDLTWHTEQIAYLFQLKAIKPSRWRAPE